MRCGAEINQNTQRFRGMQIECDLDVSNIPYNQSPERV